jgi:site-specific recombinase XerD
MHTAQSREPQPLEPQFLEPHLQASGRGLLLEGSLIHASTALPNLQAVLLKLLEHLEGAYAPNTLRAYRADMQEFIAYCQSNGKCALPALPFTVSSFLLQCTSQNIKTATVRRKISSISAIHRLSYLEDPTKHPEVKITLRKISRQLGTRFDQAFPVTRTILDKLLAVCGHDLRGLRNRALLLLAYDSMCRRSEVVSLCVDDMEWLSDAGVSILLHKSKTDQHGSGKWIHLSTEATNAVEDWLQAAQIKDGFILRGVLPNGQITTSLCDSRLSRIYKSLGKRAGLGERIVQSISGHSMRVGGAQDLLVQGASLPQIMVKGGWAKTDTVMRYVERVRPSSTL